MGNIETNLAASSKIRHWPPVPLVPCGKGLTTTPPETRGSETHVPTLQDYQELKSPFYSLLMFDIQMCTSLPKITFVRESEAEIMGMNSEQSVASSINR
jgi:hypothetical protein